MSPLGGWVTKSKRKHKMILRPIPAFAGMKLEELGSSRAPKCGGFEAVRPTASASTNPDPMDRQPRRKERWVTTSKRGQDPTQRLGAVAKGRRDAGVTCEMLSYGSMMWLRMQYLTMSVTFLALSFFIIEARCVSAVLMLMFRTSAASFVE